jgi:biopolymer transport protein ExbB/TolQ
MQANASTLGNWWVQGGLVMYPLALFSIVGVAILIEKINFLRKVGNDAESVVRMAIDDLRGGKTSPPTGKGPIHIILARLHQLRTDGMDVAALIRAAERESARLEDIALRGMIWLAIIGSTSPFIGLFGTVVGIIRAFHGLSAKGLTMDPSGNPELIKGIAEALVATATGLLVAVPAVIMYNWLLRSIRSRITRIELAASDYADALGNRPGALR